MIVVVRHSDNWYGTAETEELAKSHRRTNSFPELVSVERRAGEPETSETCSREIPQAWSEFPWLPTKGSRRCTSQETIRCGLRDKLLMVSVKASSDALG